MSNSNRTLNVKIGDETRPVVEKISLNENNYEENFFSDQYKLAFSAIEGYLSSINNIDIEKEEKIKKGGKIENNNNIFAFCGDRGSGKTSCMMSVAHALTNKKKEEESNFKLIDAKKFFSICNEANPTIDPSFFDENHNILEIVIAQMYRRFFEENKKSQYQDENKDYKRRHLCEKFERVQESLLELTKKEKDSIGGIEKLGNLSAAIYMQNDIKELVKSYLSFMHDNEDGLLILPIDDIDLNSKQAVDMMEQIRKYFIVDNIIILIAVKIDQLTMLKRQQNMVDYKALLDAQKISFDEIDTMTERYISKLIPISQRIFMPDSREWRSYKLIINSKKDGVLPPFESVRIGVLDMIYKKTRYLFYNTDVKTCYLVPENLRELRQLLCMLCNMPNIPSSEDQKAAILRPNQDAFKKYFFETWAENNISSDDRRRIMSLYNLTDVSSFNASALRILIDKFDYLKDIHKNSIPNKEKENKEKDQDQEPSLYELYYLTSPDNKVYNISLGDVLGVIDILEKQETEEENLKFLFLIKALYSIRLYEYYDELTHKNEDGTSTGIPAFQESDVISTSRAGLCKYNYHRLIGGSFVNSRIFEYISKEGNKKSRTLRLINITKLNLGEYDKNVLTKHPFLIKNEDGIWKLNKDEKDTIRLSEFFMLCTYGIGRSKDGNDEDRKIDNKLRTNQTVNCNDSLSNKQFAVFDLSSFFFNITRVEECYSRFKGGKELYAAAKNEFKNPDIKDDDVISLYAHFLREAKKREGKTQNWLSWASIRNIDVLLSLFKFMESNSSDSIVILSNYFKQLAGKTLSTYGSGTERYPIDFGFCKVISTLLKKDEAEFKSLFNLIYDDGQLSKENDIKDQLSQLINRDFIASVIKNVPFDSDLTEFQKQLKTYVKDKLPAFKGNNKYSNKLGKSIKEHIINGSEQSISKAFAEIYESYNSIK